jgi:hypothetical protein
MRGEHDGALELQAELLSLCVLLLPKQVTIDLTSLFSNAVPQRIFSLKIVCPTGTQQLRLLTLFPLHSPNNKNPQLVRSSLHRGIRVVTPS